MKLNFLILRKNHLIQNVAYDITISFDKIIYKKPFVPGFFYNPKLFFFTEYPFVHKKKWLFSII